MSIFVVKPWDVAGRGSDWAAAARARHVPHNSRRRAGASRVSVGQHTDDPRFPSPSPDAAQNPPPKSLPLLPNLAFYFLGHGSGQVTLSPSLWRWTMISMTLVDVPLPPLVPYENPWCYPTTTNIRIPADTLESLWRNNWSSALRCSVLPCNANWMNSARRFDQLGLYAPGSGTSFEHPSFCCRVIFTVSCRYKDLHPNVCMNVCVDP